jgi:AcrR family transcriptional regulator
MTRKQKILDAATKLFAAHGFMETTTSDLSRLTGVAEGTVFYHFKSKDALFLAVLESVRERILAEFEEYEEHHHFANGMEMLEGVVAFHLSLSASMEEGFLLLHRHFTHRMAMENRACREHLEDIYNCLVDLFEVAIRRGIADGSMASVRPHKNAMLVFSMVDGVIRLKNYNLYNAGGLVEELLATCRRMLAPQGALDPGTDNEVATCP